MSVFFFYLDRAFPPTIFSPLCGAFLPFAFLFPTQKKVAKPRLWVPDARGDTPFFVLFFSPSPVAERPFQFPFMSAFYPFPSVERAPHPKLFLLNPGFSRPAFPLRHWNHPSGFTLFPFLFPLLMGLLRTSPSRSPKDHMDWFALKTTRCPFGFLLMLHSLPTFPSPSRCPYGFARPCFFSPHSLSSGRKIFPPCLSPFSKSVASERCRSSC